MSGQQFSNHIPMANQTPLELSPRQSESATKHIPHGLTLPDLYDIDPERPDGTPSPTAESILS